MGGCWIVRVQVVTDPNELFTTVCSVSSDSLIVCFEDAPVPPCFASGLLTTDAQIVCDGGTFNIGVTSATDTVPIGGGYGYFLDASQGGGGGLGNSGNSFFILSQTGLDNFTADLNGILDPVDGDTPLTGTWVLRSFVHSNNANPFNNICSVSEDSLLSLIHI